ncbi:MAG: glycosyltransferase family 2 protein [Steroidobacteraceae bacterium]
MHAHAVRPQYAMNPKPTISVVIPAYNCARFITQAVESALAQHSPPAEVIVVDDGSTDDTRERLAPYFDRIQYAWQPNGGVCKARNRGISAARGELIAFLDADDQWLPHKLTKQLECLAVSPEVALVHTDILHWDDMTGARSHVERGRQQYSGCCYREFFWRNGVITSSVLLRRRCLEEVGSFDEAIPALTAEDLDLWMRIARKRPLAFVDEPLVLYRHHDSNSSLNSRRMAEGEFFVLNKALTEDPTLAPCIGPDKVRRRMSTLAVGAGYANAEIGDLRRARRYFRSALRYAPRSLRAWGLWASTFLPLCARQSLRAAKQRLTIRRGPVDVGSV